MVNDAVISHNSVNELYYLEEVDSTNTWAKANLDKFGPVGAVYTTSQTAGRGRRGHTWINASGQALYYTVVLKTELAQPESLPLFASMAVADALEQRYGIQCQIKWPNDLLLNGKKIVGILCEGMPDHHAIVCGIGINLAQPQSYFDAMELPHGTSLALQGIAVDPAADAAPRQWGLNRRRKSGIIKEKRRTGNETCHEKYLHWDFGPCRRRENNAVRGAFVSGRGYPPFGPGGSSGRIFRYGRHGASAGHHHFFQAGEFCAWRQAGDSS